MLTDPHAWRLASINSIDALLDFLREDLQWPLADADVQDLTYDYAPEELGLKAEHWPKINRISQVRPISADQPWGIFFIDFENKKLPVALLRRILNHLRLKNHGRSGQWDAGDLLFMTTYGEEAGGMREVAFAHFHQQDGDLPALNVLQWDGLDTPLKLQSTCAALRHSLGWPPDAQDKDAWRSQWREPFKHKIGHVIRTSKGLAERLAELSRSIRDRCKELLDAETENGPLTLLYKAFRSALIHDLKPADFADTFAQTITYGLLAAAISRTDPTGSVYSTAFLAEDVAGLVPITNPFLKEVLETFLDVGGRKKGGMDFDELGVQDVVELLRGPETDLPAIIRDFGNRKQGEDPVIHFYEDYLAAYNKALKVKRGVFYTPQPVVSYIVRSVHELLQTEFGLEDGLASTVTWAEMAARNPDIKIPEVRATDGRPEPIADRPFVVILDPATGTATFLVEVIDVIWKHLQKKWQTDRTGCVALLRQPPHTQHPSPNTFPAFWNAYVPDHLLPRLYGYELMMAPYAIAHMKVGLKLGETGYRFAAEKRVRIYLTNALEPAQAVQLRLALDWEALAHEAQAVKAVKETERFTVVIGNPPYSGHSVNNHVQWIVNKVHDYRRGVPELGKPAQAKWLQDDYVKFIRFAEGVVADTGNGVLGFITNHSWLDNPTFRGMRQHLLGTFSSLAVLDLHGNKKKRESSPDGDGGDDNVFDIQQGVCISLAVRRAGSSPTVRFSDAYGPRLRKYAQLDEGAASTLRLILDPRTPLHLLRPENVDLRQEYDRFESVPAALGPNGDPAPGVVTTHDEFAISWSREEGSKKVEALLATSGESEARRLFRLCAQAQWDYERTKAELPSQDWEEQVGEILYRPFDVRFTVYNPHVAVHQRTRASRHFFGIKNIGLCLGKAGQVVGAGEWNLVTCTRHPVDFNLFYRGGACNFPLYLLPHDDGLQTERPTLVNLSRAFLAGMTSRISEGRRDGSSNENAAQTNELVYTYIYGVLHSPAYRSRYAEFLKIDFPRIPLPGGPDVFRALAALGGELVALHLMESPRLDTPMTSFAGPSEPTVEKVSYARETVWIDKAQTAGFQGVPEDVWNFHIGGYQVCEKWLKDRGPRKGKPGRLLSAEDITHYHKIVVALSETIRIMREIDAVIEAHGGWPGAFAANE